MHITLYIHDFHPQIGHARAMQELLNGLSTEKKATIQSIEVVAFTAGDLDLIFPQFSCPKRFTQIFFPNLKPFLLKMFFYHIASYLHSLSLGRSSTKIGIGIACLNVDLVNVQFIHQQWEKHFFKSRNFSIVEKVYKKLLFSYFSLAEKYVYSIRRMTKYIVIANFIKTFLHEEFHTPLSRMTLIPSGVNPDEFKLIDMSNEDLAKRLTQSYPQLSSIDMSKPIALFIGALERKGIARVFETMGKIPNAQLIVIGKSENSKFCMPKMDCAIAHIPFTKEVNLFYQISDTFIFPTKYEPFGLVIIEAYAMGMDLILPIENVGASEIIQESDGVVFFRQEDEIPLKHLKKISYETKKIRREKRLELIKNFSWEKSAEIFYECLK